MLDRKQFTFYRSFWEAIRVLPKKDRLPILEAIISYALDGAEPSSLTQSQMAFFSLVRPNLDTARRKASGGSAKTSDEDTDKITARQRKDTANKKEKEKEKEVEIEKEGEKEKEDSGKIAARPSGKEFLQFWDAYPSKIDKGAAWEAWKELHPGPQTVRQIMDALAVWKKSSQWTEDGGRFIPGAAKFLSKGYYESPPRPVECAVAPRQFDEEEKAAIRRMMAESSGEVAP